MKTKLSKTKAKEEIETFFKREKFTPEGVKKIKRIAMKFNIKLSKNRRMFCKRCLSQLKGRIRISKTYKTIICNDCGYKNKFRISF